jgi:preprotein translocase subunit SecF
VFQLLKDPKFDFMGRKKVLLTISVVVVIASVLVLLFKQLNLGIEFAGGTELQIKFAETPDIGEIRTALNRAGITGADVSTIGDPDENEVYIRVGAAGGREEEAAVEEDLSSEVRAALSTGVFPDLGDGWDLNIADRSTLLGHLQNSPVLTREQAELLATSIADARKEVAIFHSFEELSSLEGMTPEALDSLRAEAVIGPFALRGQSYIGPAIGQELLNKAMFAIIGSLIGMMVYIWIRFQLQWGFAAVVALTHDTLIVLGLFSLLDQVMSLPVVAAFLTLVGYSVNDTVVVFDRIRENLRTQRASSLEALVNMSVNQTLGRTIITSGSTWVVVFGLYLFGGSALKPFAFVLSAGVLVGTYSSIYVASPILVLWKQYLERRELKSTVSGRAKKVRKRSQGV